MYFTSLHYYFLILRLLLMYFLDKRYFWYPKILLIKSKHLYCTKNMTFFCYSLISYRIISGIFYSFSILYKTISNIYSYSKRLYISMRILQTCENVESKKHMVIANRTTFLLVLMLLSSMLSTLQKLICSRYTST